MNQENKYTDIKGKKIVILGLGISGCGAANLANFRGANVFISEINKNETNSEKLNHFIASGMNGEIGYHSEKIFDADLWIVSPGIPQDVEIITDAINRNIQIISEVEFASWFTTIPIIAITGSNGKTTTAHALNQMCQTDQIHGVLAGNVGTSFSEKVLEELSGKIQNQLYVLEISSFQMEFIKNFKPFISIFLNISPDHLDRYPSMDQYIFAKMQMIKNQTGEDYIIYNWDDKTLRSKFQDPQLNLIPFSRIDQSHSTYKVNNSKIYLEEHAELINLDQIKLPGPHNLSNLLAAATAAHIIGIPDMKIIDIMKSFTGIEHRLEFVRELRGVAFINDSKATNMDAVEVAVQSYDNPLVLILGGKDKGADFSKLIPYTSKIKSIIAYGDARARIDEVLKDQITTRKFEKLREAVKKSLTFSEQGDCVLLSPGCASFDQFLNFEDRGNQYKVWVNALE
ncbi:UDP-N-acetylmuramoyl-L-alanine--D-glutamate ligase [Candidatus Neomarinimicrobiota bacterium]